ncbi:hypothetical protein KC842_01540 [Candidatus Nomurabacteria bacterium]|nr:hypothetical protein [Candidatus Nomurabacteria bacterium]USN94521.1 MAG: hypothetical protein H6791_02035 [Candidatus Nomurabacteria bacterium]
MKEPLDYKLWGETARKKRRIYYTPILGALGLVSAILFFEEGIESAFLFSMILPTFICSGLFLDMLNKNL